MKKNSDPSIIDTEAPFYMCIMCSSNVYQSELKHILKSLFISHDCLFLAVVVNM